MRLDREPQVRVVPYEAVISSEIVEDGTSVMKSSRSGQVGGALVGGLAFGAAGAIVGGLGGKRTSADKVHNIELRIVIEDTASPSHSVTFLDMEAEKGDGYYKLMMDQAREWQDRMAAVVKQGGKVASAPASQGEPTQGERQEGGGSEHVPPGIGAGGRRSVADELQKLADLRNSGVLSEAEFDAQKQRLLSSEP